MDSKLTRLRAGRPVEFDKGIYGKLNPEKKTIEFSDGLTIDVSHDRDYFPQNQEQTEHSQRVEKLQSSIGKNPLGEFGHQFSERGLLGAAKDWYQFATQKGDEYEKNKRARSEVSERIAKESPYTSMGATAASFIPDILATRGLGAAAAGAALPVLHAGPRIISEPGEVAKEAGVGLGAGYFLGKGQKFLEDASARRGFSRQVARETAELPQINAAGREANAYINQKARSSFNNEVQAIKSENANLTSQYKIKVDEAKQRAINTKNAYEKAKFDRESEIFQKKQERDAAKIAKSTEEARLNQEYEDSLTLYKQEAKQLKEQADLAEKQYQESLKNMPKLQKEAQEAYGKEVVRASEDIGKAFHAESEISPNQLGVNEFLDKNIRGGSLAGLPEEKSAERIIQGIFPRNKEFSGRELAKKYSVLESAIANSSPKVASLLNQFKTHLGQKLPLALADNLAYRSIFPSLRNKLIKDIQSSIKSAKFPAGEAINETTLTKKAVQNLDLALASVRPDNFIEKMRSGEIQNLLHNNILKEADVLSDYLKLGNLKKLQKQGFDPLIKKQFSYDERIDKFNGFITKLEEKINLQIEKTEIKLAKAVQDAEKQLGGKIAPTLGTAPSLPSPERPISPQMRNAPVPPGPLPEIPPFQEPPLIPPPLQEAPIAAPNLASLPMAPEPTPFFPREAPVLPPPQTMAEQAGDFLEKKLIGGKNSFQKLAGLAGAKYALGKAALPAEAAYLGLKGLTSPTAGGAIARQGFKDLGVQAIVQLAEKYPSYHDGILEDPRERRSLSKEIDIDPQIPPEEKAILQSKVHRGKPLLERL